MLTCDMKYPKLQTGSIPSQFPNCPVYLSKSFEKPRLSKSKLLQKKEQDQLARAIQQSKEEMRQREEQDICKSLSDISKKLLLKEPWQVIRDDINQTLTAFTLKNTDVLGPQVQSGITIKEDMSLIVYVNSVKLNRIGDKLLPLKAERISTIEQICKEICKLTLLNTADRSSTSELDVLCVLNIKFILTLLCQFKNENCSYNSVVGFVYEQLQLLTTKKHSFSYDYLIFSSIFYNLSPHAYKFLRSSGKVVLPCYTTIRRLTFNSSMDPFYEHEDNTFLFYIKQKFKGLTSSDKTVSLLVDEIHLKPFFDFKGGNITGPALNSKEAAKSAFTFMISSIFSSYKDVVYILPSNKLTSEILHGFISKTIKAIGFRVISVITDNNSINSKAMSLFVSPPKKSIVYPHPSENSRPLFFILDSVHILKCIRNNWLNLKTLNKCILYPSFNFCNISTENSTGLTNACFEAIKQLHHLECQQTVKFSYKLSTKALNPSNLERQNVKLVLQIFNNFVSQALLHLSDKFNILHYRDTSAFIQLISTWWEVVNVKTPKKGCRLNKYQQPIILSENEPKVFLKYFSKWLSTWADVKEVGGKLTKETFGALIHTTDALLEISEYCLQVLGAKYVLLGKFQTDSLEFRFGQYRQLAGGKYDVSLRQVYECEKKLRLLSVLQLKLNNVDISLSDFSMDWNQYETTTSSNCFPIPVDIHQQDIKAFSNNIPVITYIGGYCCYSINKKLKCQECKELLVSNNGNENSFNHSLIKGLDKGKLLYPSDDIVRVPVISNIVIHKLTSFDEFVKFFSQRALCINSILAALEDEQLLLESSIMCSSNHKPMLLMKMAVFICTNILLNNYCFMKNDELGAAKLAKRRKLQTLN